MAPFSAAFEVAAAGALLLLWVVEAGELVPVGVDVAVEEMTGGRDDSDGIPRVLRIGFRVSVLAVASGP